MSPADIMPAEGLPAAVPARPRSCFGCAFWDRAGVPDQRSAGLCRRHAPLVARFSDDTFETLWPDTLEGDWCGEWRAQGGAS